MDKFQLKYLIRETIQHLLEEATEFAENDKVEDSNGRTGEVTLAKHPFYAVRMDETGATESFHFGELKQAEGEYTYADPTLNESEPEDIIHLDGVLTSDTTIKRQYDLLSDIRSLTGITVVRNDDIETRTASNANSYRSRLSIKIDPYPFVKKGIKDHSLIKDTIMDSIRKIQGIKGFAESNSETSSE